ncbi:MAG: NAD(P)/FAD-dependent oxidoreductase [Microscillaceae bacterium]
MLTAHDSSHHTVRIPDTQKPRIVVIGGGFGGLELIKGLHKVECQLVLFDKNNFHTFQPLLYQVATSGLETSAIVYPFRKRFENLKDFYFRMGKVAYIDPSAQMIYTSIGSLHYDYLVLATGTTTNFYGMEDIARHAIPMKSIQDAIALRNRIIRGFEQALLTDDFERMNSYMDFVIVGGGPTGVEVAGALAELKKHVFPHDYKELDLREMDIHLVERSDRLLNGMAEVSGRKAQQFLEKLGVKVHLGQSVKSYDGYRVVLGDGTEMISQHLIWAAGVTGAPIPGLPSDSLTRGNRYQVDAFNRVKGFENIFAIGDIAAMITEETPNGHPQVAPPAMQQAAHLAKNFRLWFRQKPPRPFKYFDKGSMATIGRNKAVVEIGKFRMQGILAWFVWMFVHLMAIVGFRNRIFVFWSWVWSYLSYDKSNRLIIERNEGAGFLSPESDASPERVSG